MREGKDNMSDYLVPGSIRLDCRLIGEEEREGGGEGEEKSGHSRYVRL